MSHRGLFQRFEDAFILDGVRTPMVDTMGAFADANPIDLGIKAAQGVRQDRCRAGAGLGVGSACIGGGQGIALLVENTQARQ
jgi:acetyl-CoA acetyltransferase